MSTQYVTHSVKLTDNQKVKLQRAVKKGRPVSMKLNAASLTGSDPLPLTSAQVTRLGKAKAEGVGMVINLSGAQVSHIVKGGFLPCAALILAQEYHRLARIRATSYCPSDILIGRP